MMSLCTAAALVAVGIAAPDARRRLGESTQHNVKGLGLAREKVAAPAAPPVEAPPPLLQPVEALPPLLTPAEAQPLLFSAVAPPPQDIAQQLLPVVAMQPPPPQFQGGQLVAPSAEAPQPYVNAPPLLIGSELGLKLWTEPAESCKPNEVWIHGIPLAFCVGNPAHAEQIRGHIRREWHGYGLLADAINDAKLRQPDKRPFVMDVGANHGIYSLFAAALGADVVTVEPQAGLCRLIRAAADYNAIHHPPFAGRVWIYNHAVLETRELVSMAGSEVAEGAVATVVRGEGNVQAVPIVELSPADGRQIAFLKVIPTRWHARIAVPHWSVSLDRRAGKMVPAEGEQHLAVCFRSMWRASSCMGCHRHTLCSRAGVAVGETVILMTRPFKIY